jgi:hypothetical protein
MVFLLYEPYYVSVGHFFVETISNTLYIQTISNTLYFKTLISISNIFQPQVFAWCLFRWWTNCVNEQKHSSQLKRFLASMGSIMMFQVGWACKWFGTHSTLVWVLACVNSVMDFQILSSSKWFCAQWAAKGFISSMTSNMPI